ncbi:TetR/AcrR family transcriptional regulator [Nonomuraea sp. MG754425]|uniref:TetR/AcrR family transcriptional regulator n=1 Tax=Nonomuraea sp. MG754425 TaxID=2570319 RepID=UPI001F36DFF5|nr:TetR/AcrR family transcriptional regulator [Nonomuraea sp. MG754425]MCF6469506.1 TetR/AcrR family transcriptional regulator [Nonomuraea sp. MG754425]
MDRPLRRDAQRNRDALVAAARQVLAERGLRAPLEAVAKRAGVAIGTLYRHFPERADLIDAILAEKVAFWAELARQSLEADDAWDGLVRFLERTCEMQAHDRAFTELTCLAHLDGRAEVNRLVAGLVERAHHEGVLRADVGPTDLAFFVMANARVAEADPGQWRRHFHLMLDALRAGRPQGE